MVGTVWTNIEKLQKIKKKNNNNKKIIVTHYVRPVKTKIKNS